MTASAPCSAVARVCVPPFLLDVLRQKALIDSVTPARKESRQGQEVKQGGDKDKEDTRGEGESRQEPVFWIGDTVGKTAGRTEAKEEHPHPQLVAMIFMTHRSLSNTHSHILTRKESLSHSVTHTHTHLYPQMAAMMLMHRSGCRMHSCPSSQEAMRMVGMNSWTPSSVKICGKYQIIEMRYQGNYQGK
jgi:hypothetical protein